MRTPVETSPSAPGQSGFDTAVVTPRKKALPAFLEWAPLLLIGLLLSAAILLAGSRGIKSLRTISDYAPLLATLTAVAASGLAAIRLNKFEGRAVWGWRLMAVALLFHAAGHFFRVGLQGSKKPIPIPSGLDFCWAPQMPLILAAILLLTWPGRGVAAIGALLDGLIVALAAVAMLWSPLLESRFAQANVPAAQKFLSLYYPLFSIALLCGVSLLLSAARSRRGLPRSAMFLLAGLVVFVLANIYRGLAWTNYGWVWAGLLVGMAALTHVGDVARRQAAVAAMPEGALAPSIGPEDVATLLVPPLIANASVVRGATRSAGGNQLKRSIAIWFPYLVAAGAMGVLLLVQMKRGQGAALRNLVPILPLVLALIARQMLTLRENIYLAESLDDVSADLVRVNDELEGHVRERTRHLSTLHGITSTLNTSVDRRTVLRVALEKTMAAINATGGGIWLKDSEKSDKQEPNAPAPRDPTLRSATVRQATWTLVHSLGFGEDDPLQTTLRDLAVAAAEEHEPTNTNLLRDLAVEPVDAPAADRLILVPIRWQGSLIGVLALISDNHDFSFEDRALVESVGLEAGTALQNVRLYQAARQRADRDSVTGLLNHRAMQEQLNQVLGDARRLDSELSIILMDLNNFKFFNDTYGHQVGDEVLRTVARTLQKVFRASDIVGRYGGDEFIALLPDTDTEGTLIACQRVAAALDKEHFEADGRRIPITMAYGTSGYPRDGAAALELLTQADSSLFDYKSTGGAKSPAQASTPGEANQSSLERRRLKSRVTGGSFGVLDALVTAIDNKDRYTRRHSEEVTQMALLIAGDMDYSEESLRAVRISGLLHDVGKIAVPDEILRLPGKLSDDQWEIMKQHPVFGALIVKDLPHLDEVLGGVRHHHERYDGKGYPDGLAGDDIPIMGRILAIPDCYSAMTTDRPYRKGFEPEAALAEIERCKGTQFDPVLATIFIRAMRREIEAGRDIDGSSIHAAEDDAPAAEPSDGSVAPQLASTP